MRWTMRRSSRSGRGNRTGDLTKPGKAEYKREESEMTPSPNEHACRLQDPDEVKVRGSITKSHGGKSFRILVGRREGKATTEAQAYRYPEDEGPGEGGAGRR